MEVASCDADVQPLQCLRSSAGYLSVEILVCINAFKGIQLFPSSVFLSTNTKVLNLQSVHPKDEHFSMKFAPHIDLLLIQNVRLKGVCFNPDLLLQFRCLSHVGFLFKKQNRNYGNGECRFKTKLGIKFWVHQSIFMRRIKSPLSFLTKCNHVTGESNKAANFCTYI